MKLLILGGDGFIGYHLTKSILDDTRFSNFQITGADINFTRVNKISDPRFDYKNLNMVTDHEFVDKLVSEHDIVMPLVAIATPKTYVEKPMTVFRLDFEENLRIIKLCAKLNKRIIFPSTSEVYGKSNPPFNEDNSDLSYGPIKYSRWIYACSKQLLDRVIFAINQEQNNSFRFTLFRPFNWIGPYLDSLESSSEGSSRLITQLIDDALNKSKITLVDGGNQRRCFTDVRDGVGALKEILLNETKSNGQIFNIGNPWNDLSVRDVALRVSNQLQQSNLVKHVEFEVKSSNEFYGAGYQDVSGRIPDISKLGDILGWIPKYTFEESLNTIIDVYKND